MAFDTIRSTAAYTLTIKQMQLVELSAPQIQWVLADIVRFINQIYLLTYFNVFLSFRLELLLLHCEA